MLSYLFDLFRSGRTDKSRQSKRRRLLRQSRSRATVRLSDILEELESRRLLAVQYLGVTYTNSDTDQEQFTYEVRVTNTDTSQLWMRYNKLYDRIDFDNNSAFTNTTNVVTTAPLSMLVSEFAPFSVRAELEMVDRPWNGPTLSEDFHSASINIIGDVGTTVYLANGDPLPLGLTVSLLTSSTSPSSAININGPIDTTSYKWAYNNVTLEANTVITSAAITTGFTRLLSRDGVEIRNKLSSGLVTSYISDGNFQLIAGGEINGSTGIFLGQQDRGAGVGFNGVGGDILIDGTINGSSVTLQTNSTTQATNILTGPSGLISGGGSLTLFNAGLDGGRIDRPQLHR